MSNRKDAIKALKEACDDLCAEHKLREEFKAWLDECIAESKSNKWNIKLGVESEITELYTDVKDKYNELESEYLSNESDGE